MASLIEPRFSGTRLILGALAVAAVGLALTGVGLLVDRGVTMHAWLIAFAFVASISLGALLFLLIVHAAGSTWPVAFRRLLETVAWTFPVLLLAALPLLLWADSLYLWVDPPPSTSEHVLKALEHKEPWLNLPSFAARTVLYLAVWTGVTWILRRWSFLDDRRDARSPTTRKRAQAFSSAMLPVVALTLTFASFDWLMSLQPTWFSMVFGVYWFAGGFVASLALVTALAARARHQVPFREAFTEQHFYALGRLLFGFSCFWAYIAYFQAMLIQAADKPEEVTFYLERIEGGWMVVALLLPLGRFAIPFALLLQRSMKRSGVLAPLGVLLVVMHWVDLYWLVAPLRRGHQAWPHWVDVTATLGLGGLVVAFAAWRLRGHPLVPAGDPRLDDALRYRSPL